MNHLSEEQFADLLTGELPDELVQQHLRACLTCRDELNGLRAAVQSLGQLGFAWAQAEAPRRVRMPSRLALHLGGRPGWGLCMATLTAAAVIVCTLHVPEAVPSAPAAAVSTQTPVAPSSTDLAQDNRLLRSIDAELNFEATPTAVAPATMEMSSHAQRSLRTTVDD